MGNKIKPAKRSKKRSYKSNGKHMIDVKRAKKLEAQQNAELQASLAALPDPSQPSAAGSKDAPSTSFKAWLAAATNQPDTEPSTSTHISDPVPAPPTQHATSSSFRDWISAQAASTSEDKVSLKYTTLLPIKPTILQEPAAPMESAEPEYIALPEPEISDVVVKEEKDKPSDTIDETDILASCSTSELANIEIEPEPSTSASSTKLNKIQVYLKPRIKTRTSKRIISQKTYFDKNPQKSNSEQKKYRQPVTKTSSSSRKKDSKTERPLNRKPLKKLTPCQCQTKQLKDASTSTEDMIRVKEERDESEELRLFFELCDKYLDETTAEVAKLRASANSESSWLIVNEVG